MLGGFQRRGASASWLGTSPVGSFPSWRSGPAQADPEGPRMEATLSYLGDVDSRGSRGGGLRRVHGAFSGGSHCGRLSTHPFWKTPTRAFTSPELSSASREDLVSSESTTSHPRTFPGSMSLLGTTDGAFSRSNFGVGAVLFAVSKARVKVFQRG